MSLSNPSARPVFAQFALLDADTPEGVDELFSQPFLAHHGPASAAGQFTVTVPGDVVEKLMSSHNAEPGSFSEFVWTFDSATGEVLSAAVSGILNQKLDLGILDTEVDAIIEIHMDTLVPAGEGKPRNLMGHRISKFCDAAANENCQLIEPVDYDTRTGLVQAVGSLSARTRFTTTQTIAPLGKAIFSEVPEDRLGAAKSALIPPVSAN